MAAAPAEYKSLVMPIRFGLCTDVQAAARPTTINDEGRALRFDEATELLSEAIDFWRAYPHHLACVLHCGDIVDGREDEEKTRADLDAVLSQFERLEVPVCHVLGNHCVKLMPRQSTIAAIGFPRAADGVAYYSQSLGAGWTLIVLDTTDLSTHGGWPEGSPEAGAAAAYILSHAGEARIQRYNGGIGQKQMAWLEEELARARQIESRVIVASHHCLAPGACRESHRAWNGDDVVDVLAESGVVALALAGHDHPGGFAEVRGIPFVTVEAILEAPLGSNAFAVCTLRETDIEICGFGTSIPTRTLSLRRFPWEAGLAASTVKPIGGSEGELFLMGLGTPEPKPDHLPAAALDVTTLDMRPTVTSASCAATNAAALEAASMAAEVAWLLESECVAVFSSVRDTLGHLVREMDFAARPNANLAAMRGGKEEEGILLAAVVGSTSLHALRVQVDAFPKWNGGGAYMGMLMGGQRAAIPVPALLHVRNRAVQALAAIGSGHRTLYRARQTVAKAISLLSDAARTLGVTPPPMPSAMAAGVTSMMQPAVPAGMLLDVAIHGHRIVFSSYLIGKDGGVADVRHVSIETDEIGERLAAITRALHACRALLAKLEAVDAPELAAEPPAAAEPVREGKR